MNTRSIPLGKGTSGSLCGVAPAEGGGATHQGQLGNRAGAFPREQHPYTTSRQITAQYTQASLLFCFNHGQMRQGPDKNFLLVAAQWEIYFKKKKLFLRITFISLLILDSEMGQLSSCAAKGIFEKSLNKCRVTNLPLEVLTHSYAWQRIRDDFVLRLFCCQSIFVH